MTLNGVVTLILHYLTEFGNFGAHYVKVVEDRPIMSATECSSKNLVFSDLSFMAIFVEVTESEYIIERHLCDIDGSTSRFTFISLICVGAFNV